MDADPARAPSFRRMGSLLGATRPRRDERGAHDSLNLLGGGVTLDRKYTVSTVLRLSKGELSGSTPSETIIHFIHAPCIFSPTVRPRELCANDDSDITNNHSIDSKSSLSQDRTPDLFFPEWNRMVPRSSDTPSLLYGVGVKGRSGTKTVDPETLRVSLPGFSRRRVLGRVLVWTSTNT